MSESEEIRIPSKEDLEKLPRRAIVAFAARCARRVQPLFKHYWPNAEEKYVKSLDDAIIIAENYSITATSVTYVAAFTAAHATLTAAHTAHAAASNAAHAAFAAAFAADPTAYDVSNVVALAADPTAYDFTHVAALAADPTAYDVTDVAALAAHVAALAAAHAAFAAADYISYATFADDAASDAAKVAILYDYNLLLSCSKAEGWDDNSLVPPEFFGPIWPFGVPDEWPVKDQNEKQIEDQHIYDQELNIEVDVPDDATEEEIFEYLKNIVDYADSIHTELGGHGLEIKGIKITADEPVPEPEEVPA